MDVFGFLLFPKVYNLIDLALNRYNQETIRLIVDGRNEDNEKYSI